MNKKAANKIAQAIKKLDEAIWLCDDESDGIAIRDRRWELNDFLGENDFDVYEDSRGYHVKKVSK